MVQIKNKNLPGRGTFPQKGAKPKMTILYRVNLGGKKSFVWSGVFQKRGKVKRS